MIDSPKIRSSSSRGYNADETLRTQFEHGGDFPKVDFNSSFPKTSLQFLQHSHTYWEQQFEQGD